MRDNPNAQLGGLISDSRIGTDPQQSFVPCYFPFSQVAIQFDGTVRLCCVNASASTTLGGVGHSSIKEIWSGHVLKRIRNAHLAKDDNHLPQICRDCSYPRKGTWIAPYFLAGATIFSITLWKTFSF